MDSARYYFRWFVIQVAIYAAAGLCAMLVVVGAAAVVHSLGWHLNHEKCGDYGYWHCLVKGKQP